MIELFSYYRSEISRNNGIGARVRRKAIVRYWAVIRETKVNNEQGTMISIRLIYMSVRVRGVQLHEIDEKIATLVGQRAV